jgi:hypothetical protein
LIAIFTVLGLLLFGGGAFAIYDGWPYLVLERGFTEVIIGSIANAAGLIMLSLAWVLREIRATRRALIEAIELRAQAPLPAATVEENPLAASQARSEGPTFSRAVVPAAIGAVAGAAATGAVTQALAVSGGVNAAAPADAPASSADRDLFGALVTEKLQEPERGGESAPEQVLESAQVSAEEAPPLPDMFDDAPSVPSSEQAETQAEVEAEIEEREPFEPVAAEVQSAHEEWSFPVQAGPPPSEEAVPDEQPTTSVAAGEVPAETRNEVDLDEFSALRASLAGHLNEPEGGAGRIEPSFSPEPDPFAAAESWMDRASPRREPWLDTPPAEEPAPADEAAPLWPPRTEAPAFDAPAEPAVAGVEAEAVLDAMEVPAQEEPAQEEPAQEEPAHEEPAGASAEALPEPAMADEPQPEQAPAAADTRPASDEGIVGAYQVGDAHFTIFADGSIRARTPDGEYSFASMDELKVYLASEKSRLGV